MQQASRNPSHLGLDPAALALVALQQLATTPAPPTPIDVAIAQFQADHLEAQAPPELAERTV